MGVPCKDLKMLDKFTAEYLELIWSQSIQECINNSNNLETSYTDDDDTQYTTIQS